MSVTQGTWNTGEQIRDHRLACSVINYHGTPDAVFDDDLLTELKDFTLHRSIAARDAYVRQMDFADEAGTRPGEKAASKGSLSGYLIVRYGTADPGFDERDWELLEEWFVKGMPVGEHVSR